MSTSSVFHSILFSFFHVFSLNDVLFRKCMIANSPPPYPELHIAPTKRFQVAHTSNNGESMAPCSCNLSLQPKYLNLKRKKGEIYVPRLSIFKRFRRFEKNRKWDQKIAPIWFWKHRQFYYSDSLHDRQTAWTATARIYLVSSTLHIDSGSVHIYVQITPISFWHVDCMLGVPNKYIDGM